MNLGGYTEAESFSPYSKYDTVAAPTVNDDIADGYTPGSMRVDISGEDAYLCLNSGSGVAVWKPLTFVLSAGVPDPYIPVDGDMNITGDVSASQDVSGATATVAGAITAASLALTYAGAGDALAVDLGTELGSQAIVVTEDNVVRTPAMLQLTRQALATGPVIDITPGGASALVVRGGIIDLSIAGDGDETIHSNADKSIRVTTNGGIAFDFKSTSNLSNLELIMPSSRRLSFGAGGAAVTTTSSFVMTTAQTLDCLVLGLNDLSRNVILCERTDLLTNWGHAISADAKLIWQGSDAGDITEFGSATYVSSTQLFTLATGAGDLRLAPAANVSLAGKSLDLSIAGDNYERIISDADNKVSIYCADGEVVNVTSGGVFFKAATDMANSRAYFGTGANTGWFEVDTSQTPDSFVFVPGVLSNSFVICDRAALLTPTDYAHPQQANPTMFWQAQGTTVAQWGSWAHTGTAFVCATGAGDINLAPTGNVLILDSFVEIDEISAPGAGAADTCRLYCINNGGKTELYAQFQTGGAVQIVVEA